MALLIFYITVALLFSFLCSIAEAVLLSVTPAYIGNLAKKHPRAADILKHQKENIDRPLAAILSLNTIAHTVGAAGAGAQAATVFGSYYVGIASAILTLLILVFSEIIPKTLGAVYWRGLAPSVGGWVQLLVWGLYPFVQLSAVISRLLSERGGAEHVKRDELAALADIGAKEGQLDPGESVILKNLLALRDLRVEDIMTPRTVVFALPEHLTVDDFMEKHSDTPFSRIPIYKERRDMMSGFVLKNDLLLAQARDEHSTRLIDCCRPLQGVNTDMRISELLQKMLVWRAHLVIVHDRYGGMAGLVTLEDAVETLLGLEIVDEADHAPDMQQLARTAWEKRAAALGIDAGQAKRGPEEVPKGEEVG
jgi:CBS domain containing-hemolysin-like protein